MKTISITARWKLPLGRAVTGKWAFIGQSGSGKTYAAGVLVEQLLINKAPVIVIDIVGNWWGLRLDASGKGGGLPIPILGGDHGDIAISEHDGKQIAEALSVPGVSAVIDISDFTRAGQKRFIADFATALLAAKKRKPSPVLLVWEEVHEVCPQQMRGDDARTVGAVERLVKRGRNYGVGSALISQRVAAAAKDVLNQTEILLAFGTGAPLDRDALENWINYARVPSTGEELKELENLEVGACFVWASRLKEGDRPTRRKIHIRDKVTFDSTATPEYGEELAAGKLGEIDLGKLKASLAKAVDEAKARDPEWLSAKIRELEAKIRELEQRPEKKTIETVEVPMLKEKDLKRLEAASKRIERAAQSVIAPILTLQKAVEIASKRPAPLALPPQTQQIERPRRPESHGEINWRGKADPSVTARFGEKTSAPNGEITRPQQRVLDQMAWLASMGVHQPLRTTIAALLGVSAKTGSFNNYLSALASAGKIERLPGRREMLAAGVPVPSGPRTLYEVWASWNAVLPRPIWRVVDIVKNVYPNMIEIDRVAEAIGVSPKTGSFNNYISFASSAGLIERRPGRVLVATKLLFPDGMS